MTLFTISESEKASYVDQIYSYLGDDPFLKQFLPIDPATKDFFNLVNDGVLLCKLINIVVPGIIDERAVSTKRVLNPWERNGNHTLCLNSAKAIGCMVVNIGTQHLVEGTIIAHTKENVVKKQALTYDEMEAEREEVNNGKKSESITRQELANLDKDADSRKSAMKALKSYVKGLDSKAILQFLAQVSETRETGSLSGDRYCEPMDAACCLLG